MVKKEVWMFTPRDRGYTILSHADAWDVPTNPAPPGLHPEPYQALHTDDE